MTDLPNDLKDTPIPTDGQLAECASCRQHYDFNTESMNERIHHVSTTQHVHTSTALLAWYRIFHMRDHTGGAL